VSSRLASISVDLDSLQHYCRIHGLPEEQLSLPARQLIYSTAVRRFRELLDTLGLPATFFAIGEDVADEVARAALVDAHLAGIEIGSHSDAHDYALSRRHPVEIAQDLARADEAIEAAIGQRPVGFRAPGYTLSPALYQAVCDRGYRYDSSAFPAAPYYLAKAAVMGALRLFGRPSRAILDSPRVLLAPQEPYLPDPAFPYRRGAGPVLELPMATTPLARFPFIGTFAVTLPRPLIREAYRQLRGQSFFNFELHGIDVLDADDGVPPELARQQRDLNVPHGIKLSRLREIFSWLKDDYEVVTLADAAGRLALAKEQPGERAPGLGDLRGRS
jgi:peptidoglycan-N-acetylglucosamine deacetylase